MSASSRSVLTLSSPYTSMILLLGKEYYSKNAQSFAKKNCEIVQSAETALECSEARRRSLKNLKRGEPPLLAVVVFF